MAKLQAWSHEDLTNVVGLFTKDSLRERIGQVYPRPSAT